MDNVRFEDALDIANGEDPGSLKRIEKINELKKDQMREFLSDKLQSYLRNVKIDKYIPANENVKIYPNVPFEFK